ncbi:MAG: bifunctional 23S rRNA (guanine(2069)-N(7))-methyltransferase RlmK/23S rRNA (guanine(2445)-N(2))-methyltransferase RlmL [Alphaproteobacteria bacterium CG_4_10_14_0_2_um_filter_63_37]|nr:MAG: 23S rRNA (guanine(2445)-N(2))/(guanine(2069)-N(7))-methyltransferase [Proteobacteria bacterium CG1_02_64_396]PJA24623.1 MAG: bifunctional 23S rRNA (guanine(2069)-N(7))-methyltransferase RlmK/23S rRNA (guanine(2445)-N(2))-methyltransferase RlmL [Alphaproteobacteria bacterium CG_4_10_14_0_2_um_filter_63_37]
MDFFATTPHGLETLLTQELEALGAQAIRPSRAGVFFSGDLTCAYRVCLWSRTAGRVLLPLPPFKATTPEALYEGAKAFPWEEHMGLSDTLAVDAHVQNSQITHSQYAALRIKDAVVDRFREHTGERPNVDRLDPDLRINLHLVRDQARMSLDLAGDSLHRRGYRTEQGEAPLKEHLAAAIVLMAGWRDIAAAGGGLVDPTCGSGTLAIEAALIAGDIAPGLFRRRFGFEGWRQHDEAAWRGLKAEAEQRRSRGTANIPPIVGFDLNPHVVALAQANAARAGLTGRVTFMNGDATRPDIKAPTPTGLIVSNPPYGERLGDINQLGALYQALGRLQTGPFPGWRLAIFSGNPDLLRTVKGSLEASIPLRNGPIDCRLALYAPQAAAVQPAPMTQAAGGLEAALAVDPAVEMLVNRLRKNQKQLDKWARREGIEAYRIYDADLPEFALAIDRYGNHLHVQEYAPPKSIDPEVARRRLQAALLAIPEAVGVDPANLHFKVRERQKGTQQYNKVGEEKRFFQVQEGGLKFWVNLSDYLDTGLFLDHRTTRALVRDMAPGKRFLNLFAYTGSVSVYAAAGGARSTTTVDLSYTYLDWAERNMALNGFTGPTHDFVQADCVTWLAEQPPKARFDLIFLDPPTFSNSKRMEGIFDVQRDHVVMIRQALGLLAPGGILLFSNNRRDFRLDSEALRDVNIEDWNRKTLPQDFERHPKIHHCWRIVRQG